MIGWIKLKIDMWRLTRRLRAAKTAEDTQLILDECKRDNAKRMLADFHKGVIPKENEAEVMRLYYEANSTAPQSSLKDLQEITKRADSICSGVPPRRLLKWRK